MPSTTREIRFASRPTGMPTLDNFELADVPLPDPGDGEVQVENVWMSVDPYMRGRMIDRKSYAPPFELGQPMGGGAIGRVTASAVAGFSPGDLVQSMWGWREAFTKPAETVERLPAGDLPPQAFLGVAGMPGMTAYVGVTEVAKVASGETVFVSAASGAVGSLACQIAKLRGATVIGSAGGPEKTAALASFGVDVAIDYKAEPDLAGALARAAPDGIDAYFDNVGGIHLDAALAAAKPFARFAECGMISQYNATAPQGPANIALVVGKSLLLQGFIVSNYAHLRPRFMEELRGWVASDRIIWRESVADGLERAPEAFLNLFSGENMGKMLVRLAR